MPQNDFDQACRYLAKLDPAGVFAWLLRLVPEAFVFRGWLDTRTIPFPGEPDRTCDTVAHLEDVAAEHVPWAVPLEFQAEPDAAMFGRLMVYAGRVWLECRPDPERGSRFRVGAVVVNLTGRGECSRRFTWKVARLRTELSINERNLATESATALLRGLEAGTWSRCLLPWIPQMSGGDKPGIIQKWIALASAEPEARRRADYGGLVLVFAEAAGRRSLWHEALKEWNVIQSEQVQLWRNEGRAEDRVEVILELLDARFGKLPGELVSQVQRTKDISTLKAWFSAATKAPSLEAFRQTTNL